MQVDDLTLILITHVKHWAWHTSNLSIRDRDKEIPGACCPANLARGKILVKTGTNEKVTVPKE